MPEAFERCIRNGGKVRTRRVDKDRYQHLCFLDGKSYAVEVKPYKRLKGRKKK